MQKKAMGPAAPATRGSGTTPLRHSSAPAAVAKESAPKRAAEVGAAELVMKPLTYDLIEIIPGFIVGMVLIILFSKPGDRTAGN